MKCAICGNEIEDSFLEKIKGTIIKVKKEDKNENYYICDKCQKEYKEKLKEKILHMNP